MNSLKTAFMRLLLGASLVFGASCGVKGKPQPPVVPVVMSRGEPSFSKATEKIKVAPVNQRKKLEGDFEESPDFEISPEDKR